MLLILDQSLAFNNKRHFRRALSSRGANRKSQTLFPFVKIAEKMELYPYTLLACDEYMLCYVSK